METYLQGLADPTETEYSCWYRKTDAKIFNRPDQCAAGSNFLFAHTLLVELTSNPCFALR